MSRLRLIRWAAVPVALCAAAAAAAPAQAAGSVRRAHVPLATRAPAAVGSWRVDRSVRIVGGFRLVGVHWRGDPRVAIEARVRVDGRHFGAWFPLDPADVPSPAERGPGAVHVTEGAWVGRASIVQVRSRGRVTSLEVIGVDPGPSSAARLAAATSAAPAQPPIILRHAWGADEAIRRHAPRFSPLVTTAFVHHTATPNGYSAADSAAIVRSIYLYHVRGNGWDDIGYNFLVDRFGRVFEGRYGGIVQNVIGAHTGGFNRNSFGVAMIGDFNSVPPPTVAIRSLERLLAWRLDVAHADPAGRPLLTSLGNERYAAGRNVRFNAISGHRDAGLTDCPGSRLYALLPAIRRAVGTIGGLKIYSPVLSPPTIQMSGGAPKPVTFTARVSKVAHWRVVVSTTAGVEIASVRGTGTDVRATWNGRVATGGPLPPVSSLRWSIQATRAAAAALPAAGPFAVGAPLPVVASVTARPTVLTPDGDGHADTGAVAFSLSAPASVTVQVETSAGAPVVVLQSATATVPGDYSVAWNATGTGGTTVPSGHYRYVVTAAPTAGGATERSVAAVDVRHQVSGFTATAAISPNGDGVADTAELDFARAEAGDASIRLLAGGKVVATIARLYGQAPGAFHFSWAGAGAADGSYQLQLFAAGAGGALDLRQPLAIDTHGPVLAVARVRANATRVSTSVNVSEGSAVQVRIGARTVKTVTVAGRGQIRISLTRASLGSRRTITLVATDRLGNVGRAIRVRVL
jgi:hypothetical protein